MMKPKVLSTVLLRDSWKNKIKLRLDFKHKKSKINSTKPKKMSHGMREESPISNQDSKISQPSVEIWVKVNSQSANQTCTLMKIISHNPWVDTTPPWTKWPVWTDLKDQELDSKDKPMEEEDKLTSEVTIPTKWETTCKEV
jgi:hypothetical protein